MKKLIGLVLLLTTISTSSLLAQGGDQQAMVQRFHDRVKPLLIEQTKLTDAQAEKVIEINVNARQQMRGLRDLSEDDRKKKMDEVQAGIDKQYKTIPLTDDQIKAVDSFFEEQRKNRQQRQQGSGS